MEMQVFNFVLHNFWPGLQCICVDVKWLVFSLVDQIGLKLIQVFLQFCPPNRSECKSCCLLLTLNCSGHSGTKLAFLTNAGLFSHLTQVCTKSEVHCKFDIVTTSGPQLWYLIKQNWTNWIAKFLSVFVVVFHSKKYKILSLSLLGWPTYRRTDCW